jgi:FkbM family methyltransferase
MSRIVHSLSKRLQRLRRFPVLASRRGGMFLLDPDNWIDNRLLAGAPFEHEQLGEAARLIRAHSLDAFIDIGANIGLYTVLLGRMDEIRRVIAFEPVRRNFAQLMGNVFANRLTTKVDAFHTALGSKAGEVTIHIDPTSTGVSRLSLGDIGRSHDKFSVKETTKLARLDDICTLENARALVKIDVEGEAAAVLSGMTRTLSSNVLVLQIEMPGSEGDEARAILAAHGYVEIGAIGPDVYFAKP